MRYAATAAEAAANNVILGKGELGYTADNDVLKIGDGVRHWLSLEAVGGSGGSYTDESIQDLVGAMVSSNTETGISVTYDDTAGKLNFAVSAPASTDTDYPISAYGFVAASCRPEDCHTAGTMTGYMARIYVPAGSAITSVGAFVSTAGSGATGETSFGVYTDAGVFVAQTTSDATLFTSTGWRFKALTAPIASQGSGRFVWVGVAYTMSGNWSSVFHQTPGDNVNGGAITHRRCYYVSPRTSWPGTVTVASEGTNSGGYLPCYALA